MKKHLVLICLLILAIVIVFALIHIIEQNIDNSINNLTTISNEKS